MKVSSFTMSVLLSSAIALTACHSANNQQANQQNPGEDPPSAQSASNSTPQSGSQGSTPRHARPPMPPPPPAVIELPAGTQVRIRLDQDRRLGDPLLQRIGQVGAPLRLLFAGRPVTCDQDPAGEARAIELDRRMHVGDGGRSQHQHEVDRPRLVAQEEEFSDGVPGLHPIPRARARPGCSCCFRD